MGEAMAVPVPPALVELTISSLLPGFRLKERLSGTASTVKWIMMGEVVTVVSCEGLVITTIGGAGGTELGSAVWR